MSRALGAEQLGLIIGPTKSLRPKSDTQIGDSIFHGFRDDSLGRTEVGSGGTRSDARRRRSGGSDELCHCVRVAIELDAGAFDYLSARLELVCGVSVEDFANIAVSPARSDSARAVWHALCNSVRSVFCRSSPAPHSERRRSKNSRVERPLPLTEEMGKIRVVVQVGDGTRELSLGNISEAVQPVDLSGHMDHRLADAARGTEGLLTLLDADCPHMTRLDVHVLKELTVDRAQVRQVVRAITREFGGLTEFDNTCLDEIVLRVPERLRCLGTDTVPQNGRAGNEIALPIPFEIAGVPGMRHSRLGYVRLYRRRTRSRSSAAVMIPRA